MKTLGQLSPAAAPLAVALSLVLMVGGTYAAGGGNGAAAGTSGAGISGAASSGAGHGGLSAAPASSGAHSGVSFSNNAGAFHSTAARGVGNSSTLSLPYHNVQNTGVAQRSAAAPAVSRSANAWSGLAVKPTNNTTTAARNSTRPSARANNWTANDGFAGQRLDPGALGANFPTHNQGNFGNRNGNYDLRGRYYYYPYAYGPYYAPYVSYYGGDYSGVYPYSNDIPAANTQFSNGATTVSPEYVEQAPANANNGQQQPDASAQQPVPAPQRQGQPDANGGTIPNNGPDSLVEAVQEELVRRGYYGGKVDAMYNQETKEALRKFQTDHHLAATGLINEATMHALQLD